MPEEIDLCPICKKDCKDYTPMRVIKCTGFEAKENE